MNVLAVVTRKGGSGKTTLAAHLAVEADRAGAGPVGLIDTDPQGSLREWWAARADQSPLFMRSTPSRLNDAIVEFRKRNVRLVVIDTQPSSSKAMARAVKQSDLVLVPVRPSPHDIRLMGATVDVVEPLGKPLVFVLNAATRGARLTSQAVTFLSQHGPLAPTIIHNRVSFASSMIDGRTAMEVSGAMAASDEIARLWDYLDARLDGRIYRPRTPAISRASPDPRG